MMPKLLLVLPCYNEEEILHSTDAKLNAFYDELIDKALISRESKICYVNDGSRDATWNIIDRLAKANPRVLGVKLSKNFGHQNALLAGLFEYKGKFDCYISIDADLQDDVNAIVPMIEKYKAGASIVYGVRDDRSNDSFFKKFTAESFYNIMQWLKVPVVFNHADFRLMSRRAIEALKAYEEVNLFLRGIIPTIGFPSSTVEYARAARFAGESKYPLKKMLALAADGITSFSAVPLRLIALLGFIIFLLSMGLSAWVFFVKLFTDHATPGWASSVLPMYLLGGIQLLSIGVLGEYVAKMYMETKKRPRYFIQEKI